MKNISKLLPANPWSSPKANSDEKEGQPPSKADAPKKTRTEMCQGRRAFAARGEECEKAVAVLVNELRQGVHLQHGVGWTEGSGMAWRAAWVHLLADPTPWGPRAALRKPAGWGLPNL